jgi:hypothetical protein
MSTWGPSLLQKGRIRVEPDVQGRYQEGTEPTFRAFSRISSPITGLAREVPGGDVGDCGAPDVEVRDVEALVYLCGTWRVQRRLVDHAAGSIGTFEGVASFTAADGSDGLGPAGGSGGEDGLSHRTGARAARTAEAAAALEYHEEGELRLGEYSGPASRDLIYRAGGDGAADVRFADGREFYRLDLSAGSWRDEHLCHPDRYIVAGRVLGPDSFEERWRASGPRKDYEIITTLVRTQTGAA